MIALNVCPVCLGAKYVELGDRPVNGGDGSSADMAVAVTCPCAGGEVDYLPDDLQTLWMRHLTGDCVDCGQGHSINEDGRCVSDCEACELIREDRGFTPCLLERLTEEGYARFKG